LGLKLLCKVLGNLEGFGLKKKNVEKYQPFSLAIGSYYPTIHSKKAVI
jgi:hypothetical protein